MSATTMASASTAGADTNRAFWERLWRTAGINAVVFFIIAYRGVQIPVIVSAFPDEIYMAPKSWSERAYAKLLLYSKHDKGPTSRRGSNPRRSWPTCATGSNRCAEIGQEDVAHES